MVTMGVDAHTGLHVALALAEDGRILGHWRGPNTRQDWESVCTWATTLGAPRRWGVEGAWNYGRGLAQFLVGHGELVFEINPRWTAQRRKRVRKPGKSDRLDAHAVAQLVREEHATLPRIPGDDLSSQLHLLMIERDLLLAEATRLRNQLHQTLLQTDPQSKERTLNLRTAHGVKALETYTNDQTDALTTLRVAAIQRFATRLRLVLTQADEVATAIKPAANEHDAPLTKMCGINLLTAGALAGILGPGQQFATEAQLAAYAGVAPLKASSADMVRHQLNRGSNRRLNAIVYRVALTQAHHWPAARTYLERRQAEGKTRRESMRALKRSMLRAIWQQWKCCLAASQGQEARQAA